MNLLQRVPDGSRWRNTVLPSLFQWRSLLISSRDGTPCTNRIKCGSVRISGCCLRCAPVEPKEEGRKGLPYQMKWNISFLFENCMLCTLTLSLHLCVLPVGSSPGLPGEGDSVDCAWTRLPESTRTDDIQSDAVYNTLHLRCLKLPVYDTSTFQHGHFSQLSVALIFPVWQKQCWLFHQNTGGKSAAPPPLPPFPPSALPFSSLSSLPTRKEKLQRLFSLSLPENTHTHPQTCLAEEKVERDSEREAQSDTARSYETTSRVSLNPLSVDWRGEVV